MPSVADFLVERLENTGLKHVFNVPGDYVLTFEKKLSESKKLQLINNTDENHSGFAADAYARVAGLGCAVTTYNVGALKMCNAIAGAYAENSPVIVISGAPAMKERNDGVMRHHMVRHGRFDNQLKIFEKITCCSVVLDDPTTAGLKIDECLEKLHHYKQPIYIELPRDIANKPIKYDVYHQGTPSAPQTDESILQEALKEVFAWLDEAQRPVILAGVQLARFRLGPQLLRFAQKHNIPFATTLLSKTVMDERHPLFLGVYAGSMSEPQVKDYVESSDCLLILGECLTDMIGGFQPPTFDPRNVVMSTIEELNIKNHAFKNVGFVDFCSTLFKADLYKHDLPPLEQAPKPTYTSKPQAKLKVERLFEKLNVLLNDPKLAIVADVGESMFAALKLTVHQHHFICPAFYTSMGFAIPGSLGVQLAQPDVRPIVLVGDGAFQMSCTDLGTLVYRKSNAIVFVLNNRGYATERVLLDGPFNDIPDWNYERITDVIGGGRGFRVETEEELEAAVSAALASDRLSVINVILDPKDVSDCLRKMGESFARTNKSL